MVKRIAKFVFNVAMFIGSLSCLLVWLGVKPRDLWGWHMAVMPHWLWLILAIVLFALGIAASVYSVVGTWRAENDAAQVRTERDDKDRELKSALREIEKLRQVEKQLNKEIENGGNRQKTSKLRIIRALYGAGGERDIDITDKLKSEIRDALFVPVDNNLVPHDPAIGTRKRVMVEYSYGNGVVECAIRYESTPHESVSLTLPEDSEIKKLRLAVQEKNEKENVGVSERDSKQSLRDRVFDACGELKSLLDKHGRRPNPYLIPNGDQSEFIRIYNETVQSWDNKFQADYWKNYKNKIVELRHELALETLTDDGLDNGLMEADTNSLSDVTIMEIDKGLRALASKLQ